MLQRGDLAYSAVLLAFDTYKQHLFFIVCYYSIYNWITLLYKIIRILKVYAAFYKMLNYYYILVNRIQRQNTKAGLIFKYSSYRLIICFTFYIIIFFFNNWYKANKDIYRECLLALNLLVKITNGKIYWPGRFIAIVHYQLGFINCYKYRNYYSTARKLALCLLLPVTTVQLIINLVVFGIIESLQCICQYIFKGLIANQKGNYIYNILVKNIVFPLLRAFNI